MTKITDLSLKSLSIIKKPIITDKTTRLLENNQYTFLVDPKANKTLIKASIELIFEVEVVKINTYHPPRKNRRIGKFMGSRPHYKRAIVKLASGDSIDLFPEE
uniref:Large ribosomal subunit protein uL23c n=1 Tax=Bangiopsis subsimplex TaxID=139980 RepID=A0A1C9CD50_9RHOD|nr:ribosomal protein L23 [Bangiopsis subsimplex]AOM66274.1 ribosomal protein L23 [Bangiopsis subsimplex]ARO90364.1 50S ribosomal protein L23 [Bangiopsis subsimplex]